MFDSNKQKGYNLEYSFSNQAPAGISLFPLPPHRGSFFSLFDNNEVNYNDAKHTGSVSVQFIWQI